MKREKAAEAVGLTAKQLACLRAVEAHHARTDSMPSVEQLRAALGLASKSGAVRLLTQLEQRGAIRRLSGRARAIRVLREETCPHCGKSVDSGPAQKEPKALRT